MSFPLLLPAAGCSRRAVHPSILITLDLRHPDEGIVRVGMEVRKVAAGRTIELSSFIQPAALRVGAMSARQDGSPLVVETGRDDRGFARFVVAAPSRSGAITVEYAVRPGVPEEAQMSGPTGYRFGHLDGTFGMFGGRQIALLPVDPAPPAGILIRFLLPAGWTVAAPWRPPPADAPGRRTASESDVTFELHGPDAAARLVQATIGTGEFVDAGDESLRVHVLKSLPQAARNEAVRRALALDDHLATLLGRSDRSFDLILVPKAPDGMLVSVAPGPDSFGLSLGEGLPARWLSIGRAVAQSYISARTDQEEIPETDRWIAEALPTYLMTGFSEQDGWRSRQAWLEQFYYTSAGLSFDLRQPGQLGDAPDPMMREWRGALVLAALSEELTKSGSGTVEDVLRTATAGNGPTNFVRRLSRDLPRQARALLDRWLSPSPYPFPFPGSRPGEAAIHLPAPPQPAALATETPGRTSLHRLDLYFGGRNFGLLEQCGCRSKQAGGQARRATVLRSRLSGRTPALAIELGDTVPFDQNAFVLNRQKIVESDLVIELMAYAGMAGSVVSHAELNYGPDFLSERARRLPHGFRLLSANVSAPGLALAPVLRKRVGGVDLRVIGIEDPSSYHLGRALEFEDAIAGVTITNPAEAVARGLQGRPGPGLTVVAGSINPTTVLEIHRRLPELSLIVTDDYFRFGQDPRLVFDLPMGSSLTTLGRLGKTLVVLLQTDAYALARLGLRLDQEGRIVAAEMEDIILDETIQDDARVRQRLDAHYARLAAESGLAEPAPIGTRLRDRLDAAYAGAAACETCHRAETDQWTATPHATAFATLLTRRRQGVPGCYACHVTGYRQPTGYRTTSDLALRHVRCEACHGPGSKHLSDPRRDNIVRVPAASVCRECHTEKHSDMNDRNFASYWAKVVHRTDAPSKE